MIQLISTKYLKSKADLGNFLTKVKKEETGATAVEYALIVGLIAVVIIVAVTALGNEIAAIFQNIVNSI